MFHCLFPLLDIWTGYLHQNHRAKGADRVIIDARLADGRIGCRSFPFLRLACMAARCLILVPGLGVPRKAPVMITNRVYQRNSLSGCLKPDDLLPLAVHEGAAIGS